LHLSAPCPTVSRHPNWITGRADWVSVSHWLLRTKNFHLCTPFLSISQALHPELLRGIYPSRPLYLVARMFLGGRRSVATQFALGNEL
jgi:hypothetical protein